QRLADAHVQSMRVYEQVRTHKKEPDGRVGPDAAFLATFELALSARSDAVARARQPIDDALGDPERFGERQLAALRVIDASLDELQRLVEEDEASEPSQVLVDASKQNRIDQLFKALQVESKTAVAELRAEVGEARQKTETRTLMLMAAIGVLGVLAT